MTPIRIPAFAVLASAILALAVALPARAGMIEIAPGATGQIDVADRGSYTTMTISNSGTMAGRLELGPPASQVVDVPAGGKVELYGAYGQAGSYLAVKNTGSVPLRILTRYQERVRLP